MKNKKEHNHMKHMRDSDNASLRNLQKSDRKVEQALKESNKRVFKKSASMKIDW
jgi:hypothetical protein